MAEIASADAGSRPGRRAALRSGCAGGDDDRERPDQVADGARRSVNKGMYAGRSATTSAATTSPLPSPQREQLGDSLLAPAAGFEAPSAWPTIAWLAIANASGGMASRYHSVNAI